MAGKGRQYAVQGAARRDYRTPCRAGSAPVPWGGMEKVPGKDPRFPRIGSMDLAHFREHLSHVAPEIPCDPEILRSPTSPLSAPVTAGRLRPGNRWCIQPMEGWDGTRDGNPTELTFRRWRRFGQSGAKLIWGGEAVAVLPEGRANPHQLVIGPGTLNGLAALRRELLESHRQRFGSVEGLVIGLQLTHSGRFSRPGADAAPAPRVAFRHPILDRRAGVTGDDQVLGDSELDDLVERFVAAARDARDLGFDFVDIKHCHGYLLHELLGGHTRPGRYGGSFENRTRFLREVTAGIRRDAPGIDPAVRVSIFDVVPFRPDPVTSLAGAPGAGIPENHAELLPYRLGFGVNEQDPTLPDLSEGRRFLELLPSLGISLVNLSGGSPYTNPHVQRPALYPPSDGYLPPEDPLCGVARHLRAARDLRASCRGLVTVASAVSYLQDFLPHVAQALVREGWTDLVGYGRMVLSYPDLAADALERGVLDRKRICRTFSDCTTAPRNGLVSGCYPLDKDYAALPDGKRLREIKSQATAGGGSRGG